MTLTLYFSFPVLHRNLLESEIINFSLQLIQSFNTRINSVNHAIEKANGNIPPANEKIRSANKKIAPANRTITSVNRKITPANREITSAIQEIALANQEIVSANRAITSANRKIPLANRAIEMEIIKMMTDSCKNAPAGREIRPANSKNLQAETKIGIRNCRTALDCFKIWHRNR